MAQLHQRCHRFNENGFVSVVVVDVFSLISLPIYNYGARNSILLQVIFSWWMTIAVTLPAGNYL